MLTKTRFVLLILIVLAGQTLWSRGEIRTLSIQETAAPPRIDGSIDDACWQGIKPLSGFFQNDPVNGAEASEKTLVWAAYDNNNIYFAFLMKDSRPEKIWAELTPRNRYYRNDSITVILDTYNDKRTNLNFTVNARGVQKNSVETIWKSGAVLRKDGWSAEVAIPFKSLRFSTAEKQTWGVNFLRYIQRLNEKDYWNHVDRSRPRQQQNGILVGLEGVKPTYNLEFFPYFGGRLSRWAGEKDDKVAVGLDFKYGILPNLILDMTASPDFSEVESDPFIYQLSPYENYMRENRPFFTEGSQYFGAGGRRHWGRQSRFNLFYTRRIDSPKLAAKITGKTDGWSFGLLGAFNKGIEETEDEEGVEDNFFSVVRIQKDIFKNSQIGIYYAGIDEKEDYNRNFGVDYNFNFKDFYYIRGQSAFSLNKNIEKEGAGMHVIQFERDPDAGLQLELYYKRVEENVDVRTGYINRTDIQETQAEAGYAWRFNGGRVKRVSTGVTGEMGHDCDGAMTKKSAEIYGGIDFLSELEFDVMLEAGESRYQVYDEEDNLFWTADFIDVYGGRIGLRWHRGGFLKGLNIWTRWHHRGIYNDEFTAVEPGGESNVDVSITLRPRSNFEFSVGGEWTRQTIDSTGEVVFSGITYKTNLHYQFTRNLFLSTRLKGETRDNQYNMDVLVGYYFGAGNIVQLSFKKSSRLEEEIMEKGYSITLKISYLLRV
ncbi:MAG: carbohydrate binding family 9 domain-containing protein [Candidatus Aminicenantes bacterium]|nr:carbohydrate binding family 9 domain-containing protein [Candidatus Aminicenantes bacterium]